MVFSKCFIFINPLIVSYTLKARLLKLFGAKVGKRCLIKPGVNIKYPWRLEIGDYVSIGENVWIDNLANVYLKDQVTISQGAMLLTGNHNYKKITFDLIIGEITLEEGSWVGAKCLVGLNVTLGTHSVLTAGSTAFKSLESFTINAGNPAIEVRKRIISKE